MKLSDEEIVKTLNSMRCDQKHVTITDGNTNLMVTHIPDLIRQLMEDRDRYREVLKEISKGCSRFSEEQLIHGQLCVRQLSETAKQVLGADDVENI
jgi:hypothetical protein